MKAKCFKNQNRASYKGAKADGKGSKEPCEADSSMITFVTSITESKGRYTTKWLVDSAASAHIANDEVIFTDLEKKKSKRTVSIGDGSDLFNAGEGKVGATTIADGMKHEVVQKGILLVPKLSWKLLSVSLC